MMKNTTAAPRSGLKLDLFSTTGGFQIGEPHYVVRSTELLSCARTALRILQQQSQQGLLTLSEDVLGRNPNTLSLYVDLVTTSQLNDGSGELTRIHPTMEFNPAFDLLQEAEALLGLLDVTLIKLSSLVKRRGHTNDPTEEINSYMTQFHTYTKDLCEIVQKSLAHAATLPFHEGMKSSQQRRKHFQIIATSLQHKLEEKMKRFKDIMMVRGDAINQLSQRRRRLLESDNSNQGENTIQTSGMTSDSSKDVKASMNHIHTTSRSQWNSPLFTLTDSVVTKQPPLKQSAVDLGNKNTSSMEPIVPADSTLTYYSSPANGSNVSSSNTRTSNPQQSLSLPPSVHSLPPRLKLAQTSAYGGGYNHGYDRLVPSYGNSVDTSSTGIRRRGLHQTAERQNNIQQTIRFDEEEENRKKTQDDSNYVQTQIQMRRQTRQTQARLESAREAEKSLTELTTMFHKMSTLIQSQGEVLMKVEDDVEAAMFEVDSGADQIIKIYSVTKGNRGLIIKVFALLIFFVVFMKFY